MTSFCPDAGRAVEKLRHLVYFHDHARIEAALFDGVLPARGGVLTPDPSRAGLGLELKRKDADPYCVYRSAG